MAAERTITRTFHIRLAVAVVALCVVGLLLGGSAQTFSEDQWLWIAMSLIGVYAAARRAVSEATKYVNAREQELEKERRRVELEQHRLSAELERTQTERMHARAALRERAVGLPTLLNTLETYYLIQDEGVAKALEHKSRPACKAAETVREETRRRRVAERAAKEAKAIVDYYESIAPFLIDFKEEIADEEEDAQEWLRDYSDEEREDATTRFLTKSEYRTLPPGERNELALRRYWERHHSASTIGKMYERYVGYWYESQGYSVEYNGIFKGYEDLGRDLICRRKGAVSIAQCKNWSQQKTIHEKHIFQLFGSTFLFRRGNPGLTVRGAFFTSTKVSDVARDIAGFPDIDVLENFPFDKGYPSIKCNISRRTGERIYHLPFDQQYDKVIVEPPRGEFYCRTVAEAERQGFRRAFRYRPGN